MAAENAAPCVHMYWQMYMEHCWQYAPVLGLIFLVMQPLVKTFPWTILFFIIHTSFIQEKTVVYSFLSMCVLTVYPIIFQYSSLDTLLYLEYTQGIYLFKQVRNVLISS
jgi:hypothetical protein